MPVRKKSSSDDGNLPFNEDIEKAVLGLIIEDNDNFDIVSAHLKEEDFYLKKHRIIYSSISKLIDVNGRVDFISLIAYLKEHELMEDAGGISYVSSIVDEVASVKDILPLINTIKNNSLRRKLYFLGKSISETALRVDIEVDNMFSEIEHTIVKIGEERVSSDLYRLSDFSQEVLDEIEERMKEGGKTGISTGYADLDKILGGLQRQNLIIVAGRPGMGKTSLVLNFAYHAALKENKCVAIFSLEMSKEDLFKRLLSISSSISFEKIRDGDLSPSEAELIFETSLKLSKLKIFIDETGTITLSELREKARRIHKREKCDLLIIDYLQLMTIGTQRENKAQEVALISSGLKALSKELNLPVIAISQLNRAPEGRGKYGRPRLADLRESGAIEQDADVVMFVYRPYKYIPMEEFKDVAEIIVAKHRNGPDGSAILNFAESTTKFFGYMGAEKDSLLREILNATSS